MKKYYLTEKKKPNSRVSKTNISMEYLKEVPGVLVDIAVKKNNLDKKIFLLK